MQLQRLAPAKVNLMLHVVDRFPDGYHDLQSLITFVDAGDQLCLEGEAQADDLKIIGEFAGALDDGQTNSVIQAKEWFYRYFNFPELFFKIELQKKLPVAAGIGGGTSDAAAMIATLLSWYQVELSAVQKQELIIASGILGADVPVCLACQLGLGSFFWLNGSGKKELPQTVAFEDKLDIILITPNIPVSTGAIFKALKIAFSQAIVMPIIKSKLELLEFMSNTQNDLEFPARIAHPSILDIPEIVGKLAHKPAMCRQSGSGATYLVVVEDKTQAQQLAKQIQQEYPQWWIQVAKTL